MEIQTHNIIPIVVPQKYYVDQYGLHNAYFENNLSLFIHGNKVILLIRQINYRKFKNQHYTLGSQHSISHYCMMVGNMDGDKFVNIVHYDIIYDWNNFTETDAQYKGMDDIRFINHKDLLVICSDRNVNLKPCLFHATLESNVITLRERLQPSVLEKNWMPYRYRDNYFVIYHVSPFTVKSIFNDDRRVIELDDNVNKKLEGYHGSTNGIEFKGELLFLIHRYTCIYGISKIVHRWVMFDPIHDTVKVSEEFSFFNYSFLEFNCSIQYYNGLYYLSLAVNEDKIYVVVLTPDMITI